MKRNNIGLANGIDLLDERIGAKALLCSDDFFAEMDNLTKFPDAIFIPEKYTERGKWMDGWESRRKREKGYDWCILRLGVAGSIRMFDIDTAHFLGNHAPIASIEGACAPTCADTEEELRQLQWFPLLDQVPLARGSQNLFVPENQKTVTHVRLNMFPDGGIARLRAYGQPNPSWKPSVDDARFSLLEGEVDLAALRNGAQALLCSDMFFGEMSNLIAPGRARVMGEGWETRRSRRIGSDWIVVRLGTKGTVSGVVLDTNHFKGNFPESASVFGVYAPNATLTELSSPRLPWREIVPRTKLRAHEERFFRDEIVATGPFDHVMLRIYPDGGVSRMRIYGRPEAST